jgi:hypothetical protein
MRALITRRTKLAEILAPGRATHSRQVEDKAIQKWYYYINLTSEPSFHLYSYSVSGGTRIRAGRMMDWITEQLQFDYIGITVHF